MTPFNTLDDLISETLGDVIAEPIRIEPRRRITPTATPSTDPTRESVTVSGHYMAPPTIAIDGDDFAGVDTATQFILVAASTIPYTPRVDDLITRIETAEVFTVYRVPARNTRFIRLEVHSI